MAVLAMALIGTLVPHEKLDQQRTQNGLTLS